MNRRKFVAAGFGTALLSRNLSLAQAVASPHSHPQAIDSLSTQDDGYAFEMASRGDITPWMHEVIKQEAAISDQAANTGLLLSQSMPGTLDLLRNSQMRLEPGLASEKHSETIQVLRNTPSSPRFPAVAFPEALKADETLAITSKSGRWSFMSAAKLDKPKETIVIRGLRNTGAFADNPPMYYTLNSITVKDITVPQYFVTDLTSIPRAFCCLLRPDGPYAYAAIAHDWLYWQQNLRREDADWLLKIGMEAFNVSSYVVGVIYEAVRKGGQSAWNANATLKAQGQKREMKVVPSSPLVLWDDWRKDASHFV